MSHLTTAGGEVRPAASHLHLAPVPAAPAAADFTALAALLRDAVEGGASLGFMLPVRDAEMTAYWQRVFAEVADGTRVVIAARSGGAIVGSVQLELAQLPASRHRAELQKLLVLQAHRRRGLGSTLLNAAEAAARERGRTLIVLDTSTTGNALGLYARNGYLAAGSIPQYARDPDGQWIDTMIYYKQLDSGRVMFA